MEYCGNLLTKTTMTISIGSSITTSTTGTSTTTSSIWRTTTITSTSTTDISRSITLCYLVEPQDRYLHYLMRHHRHNHLGLQHRLASFHQHHRL